MRLLFDQNLSPRLVRNLELDFPGSSHVRNIGLDEATDSQVWAFAQEHQFIIVSKDDDFRQPHSCTALCRR